MLCFERAQAVRPGDQTSLATQTMRRFAEARRGRCQRARDERQKTRRFLFYRDGQTRAIWLNRVGRARAGVQGGGVELFVDEFARRGRPVWRGGRLAVGDRERAALFREGF